MGDNRTSSDFMAIMTAPETKCQLRIKFFSGVANVRSNVFAECQSRQQYYDLKRSKTRVEGQGWETRGKRRRTRNKGWETKDEKRWTREIGQKVNYERRGLSNRDEMRDDSRETKVERWRKRDKGWATRDKDERWERETRDIGGGNKADRELNAWRRDSVKN